MSLDTQSKSISGLDVSPTSPDLTVSYGAGPTDWESSVFNVLAFESVRLLLTFAGGIDATTVEIKSLVEDQAGTNFFTDFLGTPPILDERVVTVAQLAAEGSRIALTMDVKAISRIKWRAKRTGGTVGTMTMEVLGG